MSQGGTSRQQSTAIPNEQWLIVLSGVVGSGKSSLSQAFLRLPGWTRVCQDDLGDRRACEQMVESGLARGNSVIVDRQNFDAAQRRTWLEIASRYAESSNPGLRVAAMVMSTPPEECARRLRVRQNHPTIHDSQLALSLLDKFLSLWAEPSIDEGFDHLITLPALPPPQDITPDLIHALMLSLSTSPRNLNAPRQRQPKPRRGYIPPVSQTSSSAARGGGMSQPWNSGSGSHSSGSVVTGGTQPWLSRPQGDFDGPSSHSHASERHPANRCSQGRSHVWGQGRTLSDQGPPGP